LLKVGIIGLGHMGQLHLLNALRIENISIVAAADISERNRKYAENYHIKTYDDYTKLIDSEKLDAVVISLPNFIKKDCALYAAENKLDVFLDKPFARNYKEGLEIVQKVQKENTRLMVGTNYRYFPCVQEIKKNLNEGKIGDPVIATSDLIMNGPLSHGLVPVPVADWWLNKELSGGGALLDLGYHLIDMLVWLFGDFEVNYSDLGYRLNLDIEDSGTVVLKNKTGITCIVNVGWFSRSIFPDFNFRLNIHGTVGFDTTDHYTPRDLRMHAAKTGLANIGKTILRKKIDYLHYSYYYSSFYWILEEFFSSLEKGSELPVSLEKQLETIRIIETAYQRAVKKHE
jgi:predicted dehydrogenase